MKGVGNLKVVNAKTIAARIVAGIAYILTVLGILWTFSLNEIIAFLYGVFCVYMLHFVHWMIAYVDISEAEKLEGGDLK